MIIVLDFGSQYAQMISRRLREIGCYNLLLPWNSSIEKITSHTPKGIIISGGPNSVHAKDAKIVSPKIFELGLPILGICYGMQSIASFYNGKVSSSQHSEYGRAELNVIEPSILFEGLRLKDNSTDVWMSHGDSVDVVPEGFSVAARTSNCSCAAFARDDIQVYGVQFHPEVNDTPYGKDILRNFVKNVCQVDLNWLGDKVLTKVTTEAAKTLGDDKVLLALSGGVDSMVLAHVLQRSINKDNLYCVLVDHGMLRENEVEQVLSVCSSSGINLEVIDAKDTFLNRISGVTEPESKRKIIGKLFVDEFEKYAKSLSNIKWLAQGTIYPDVIESAGDGDSAKVIKSHHNVGGLPEKLGLDVIEPFRELYKDEVRMLGREMDISDDIINRHPFPGPGLSLRIIGEITKEKISLLQKVDKIWLDVLHKHDIYNKISQAFAVLLPVSSVGVVGDNRHYGPVIALRAVTTDDFMTAKWSRIEPEILDLASTRIINEVPEVSRVVYDISSKPPATIEWE